MFRRLLKRVPLLPASPASHFPEYHNQTRLLMCHRIYASTLKSNINMKCWVKPFPGSTELKAGGWEVGRTRFCSFRISHKPTQSSHKSSDIWNSAFIPDLPPTISQQCFHQCFCLLPTPSLVFYSFLCSRSLGKSLLQLHPGMFTRKKQTEQEPVDGGKSLLQPGIAAPWTQAGAITALNAKDNIQKGTAKDSREMGVDNRYSLGACWKHLSDFIQSYSSPHTTQALRTGRNDDSCAPSVKMKSHSLRTGLFPVLKMLTAHQNITLIASLYFRDA